MNGKQKAVAVLAVLLSLLVGVAVPSCSPKAPAAQAGGDLVSGMIETGLLVVLEVAVPVIAGLALREYKKRLQRMREREWWYELEQMVHHAVRAAEQRGLIDDLEAYGGDKLEAAIAMLEEQLAARGYILDLDQHAELIRTLIEAEVNRQFPKRRAGG
jgi:hypothetical protein